MDTSVSMLISVIAAASAIGAAVDPELFVSAESVARDQVQEYDEAKRKEYDQICELMDCTIEDGRYVL